MKKFLKICGIIVGALLAAVLAAALIFPGIPQYFYIKNNCVSINVKSVDYPYGDVEPLEQFTRFNADGITLKLPRNMYYDADADIYTDGRENGTLLYISEPDTEITQKLFEFNNFPGISAETWNSFFSDIGGEAPETMYDFMDMAYKLDMSSMDIHSKKKSKAFFAFAQLKESIGINAQPVYNFKTENASGFIYVTEESNQWLIDLFPANDKNNDRIIIIQSYDKETMKQIAAGIDTAEDMK